MAVTDQPCRVEISTEKEEPHDYHQVELKGTVL